MRAQFDEIVGTPPPSTIDTRAIERRVRRTRLGVAASVLAASVLAAAGLTGVVLVGDEPPVDTPAVAWDTSPPTSTAPPPDNRFQLRADTRANGEASARQLAALIEKATGDVAPGAVWTNALNIQFVDGATDGPWSGSGSLRVGGRVGNIFVMTQAAGTALTCPPATTGCVEGTSPGGRKTQTFDGGRHDDGSRLVRAAVAMPGGLVIIVHHIPEESGPVLSADQFLRIFDAVAGQVR